MTREDVLNNIAYVFSAVEIIDSRYKDFDFKLSDVIADNSSAKGYIFSKQKIQSDQLDLAKEKVEIVKNGSVIATGSGKNVLNHPAESIVELANMLGEQGQIVKKVNQS